MIEKLILPLPRPQYVRVPEGFVTSLAWSAYSLETEYAARLRGQVMFRPTDLSSPEFTSTAPRSDSEMAEFGAQLKASGLTTSVDDARLGMSFVEAISGVTSDKGKGQAASPMSPSLAMLQNVKGVHAVDRPPNLAKIFETIYSMGNALPVRRGVADRWADAMQKHQARSPLLGVLDNAVAQALLRASIVRTLSPTRGEDEDLLPYIPNSPFTWFAKMWDTLTSDGWVHALPPRVWTDWATTLLRTAIAASYLWEASWTDTLGRHIVAGRSSSAQEVRHAMPEALEWRPASSRASIRDVAPILKWRVLRATEIRAHLDKWLDNPPEPTALDSGFAATLRSMHGDDGLRLKLSQCLSSGKPTSRGTNAWYAIRYSLLTRDGAGDFPDHYGFLRASGRFLTPEPRTEWLAVIASLNCPAPAGETDVGRVLDSLTELGLRPDLTELIRLLELAGLARGSADADLGVRVSSAF